MIARAAAAPLSGDNCERGVSDAPFDVGHLQLDADDARRGDEDRRWIAPDRFGRARGHRDARDRGRLRPCTRWRSRC